MGKQAELTLADGPEATDHTQAVASAVAKPNRRKPTPRLAPKPVKPPGALVPLSLARDNRFTHLIEAIDPVRTKADVVLSASNTQAFLELIEEYRHADTLRRHGLNVTSKLLFCGPPGCGKTLTAEVFAHELGLPLLVARLDAIISSFLGETASNLRKLFEEVERRPVVLFLDEFDALARTRSDRAEHSEMRRVVNSLLMLVDRYKGKGFVVAATNVESTLDEAVWRRFDDVVIFELPEERQIRRLIELKTKNFPIQFQLTERVKRLAGYSYADIERVCVAAIKRSILKGARNVIEQEFDHAIAEAKRRRIRRARLRKG
jgi:SpoVK/Ycf46/Vps4 family AAA+-type ATPase